MAQWHGITVEYPLPKATHEQVGAGLGAGRPSKVSPTQVVSGVKPRRMATERASPSQVVADRVLFLETHEDLLNHIGVKLKVPKGACAPRPPVIETPPVSRFDCTFMDAQSPSRPHHRPSDASMQSEASKSTCTASTLR